MLRGGCAVAFLGLITVVYLGDLIVAGATGRVVPQSEHETFWGTILLSAALTGVSALWRKLRGGR